MSFAQHSPPVYGGLPHHVLSTHTLLLLRLLLPLLPLLQGLHTANPIARYLYISNIWEADTPYLGNVSNYYLCITG